ncbi:hypothetical protein V502_09110 [Pseudogymnoascus sp. VKM F-4520 (FW-2644)]|nr:hypothetical protein V502_09110 [Pseudogymnoascus sp. VKM F-4520 (FW-2644)]
MHTPPQEDPRDRRRRQNRESQRRWRERYRQTKPDDANKPKETLPGADEALLAITPPISDLQSRPQSKHSLEPPDHNDYFAQHINWIQDQPTDQPDAHVSWPPMDVSFHLQQGERCASSHSRNDELSRENSANGYLNAVDEALIQASPDYFVSSQIRGQFSHFPSVGTCHPALLTPPASSSSAGIAAVYPPAKSGGRCRETETSSTAVETIRDVELLYSIGVKAGFLKPDDKVKYYLAAMKRIYHKAPTLMDEDDDEDLSGSDIDEWGDGALSDGGKLALPLQYQQ